jgi:hypothetical protein
MRALLVLLVPHVALAQDVSLDKAPQAIADAIAKVDLEHAKTGETLVIATITPNDKTEKIDAKATRDALAKLKLKLLDDRMYGTKTVLTLEAANGVRVRMDFDAGGGTIAMTARPASTKPPGKCVAIPNVEHRVYVHAMAINQDGEPGQGTTYWDLGTKRIHDVDGDGIADAFVPVAKSRRACPEDVAMRVFVVRGSCGHDLGVIGPGTFQFDAGTAALDASGFRPFTMSAQHSKHGKKDPTPHLTTTTRVFAVKGGKYEQVSSKTTSGACHHCATWYCTAK